MRPCAAQRCGTALSLLSVTLSQGQGALTYRAPKGPPKKRDCPAHGPPWDRDLDHGDTETPSRGWAAPVDVSVDNVLIYKLSFHPEFYEMLKERCKEHDVFKIANDLVNGNNTLGAKMSSQLEYPWGE